MFVEECKYTVKEKKMPEYNANDIDISPDYDREEFDEKNLNEKNSVQNTFYNIFFCI